jgi:TolB-like protein
MGIALLGGIAITSEDGGAVSLPTRKTLLVLAILALLGERGTTRETLAEWVWPDRSEGQSRTSLRQALAAIRKIIPSVLAEYALEADLDTIRLAGPADLIDARRFEELVKSPALADWVGAANIYGGDLLDGIALDAALEVVVAAHRESLRQHALYLVEALSEIDDPGEAARGSCEALANRLLMADPAAEEAHRALIRLRLVEGQTNAARRQLERCIEAVAASLGTEPEVRTVALLSEGGRAAAALPTPKPAPRPAEAAANASGPCDRQRTRPSVVVMPFDNLGPDQDAYFADGVVEEITSALSRIRDFFVIARQSAYTYKGRFVDVREVGRDLGVRYAVEGTVRRGGDKVRITVQLVETGSATQLWSDRYEGGRSDLFELQDRIASHVAGAINPSIRSSEIELARRTPPENLQAYDLVLRALPHFWAHRKEDNQIALDLFTEALARDPDYGVAMAFKGWCHAQQACYLWADDPGTERANAIATAQEAAKRVTDHSTALAGIGATYSLTTQDQRLAQSFVDRSLAIDPNNAWAWMRAGWLKVLFSLREDAISCFERALALSPFDPFTFNIYFGMAAAHCELGDLRKAIELAERGLMAGPGVTWAYRMLASYKAQIGDRKGADEALAKFLEHYPGVTIEKMRAGLPPSLEAKSPNYWEGMRKAGIPER